MHAVSAQGEVPLFGLPIWRQVAACGPLLVWGGGISMRPLADSAADQHRPTPANGHRSATLGRLVFHVFAALAEFIRELIVEGTREGLDAARARGQRLGRPPAMTAEQIRQAHDLLTLPGNSISSIARLLGVSRSTIYKHLPELASGHRPAA